MMRPDKKLISAAGTAARSFAAGTMMNTEDALSAFAERIRQRLQLLNAEEGLIQIALEVLSFEEDRTTEQKMALLLMVTSCIVALKNGSTRITLDASSEGEDFRSTLATLLFGLVETDDQEADSISPDQMVQAIRGLADAADLSNVIGTPAEFKPLIYDPPHLYLHKMFHEELRFIKGLLRIAEGCTGLPEENAVQKVIDTLEGSPLKLTSEQRAAVLRSATKPLTVISGGPGTGKTSIILAIIRTLIATGTEPSDIALAAPTGKAANRLAEALSRALEAGSGQDSSLGELRPPRTLHRLLGYSPSQESFRHHLENRLEEAVIIIDEASMIGLSLLCSLLDSIRSGARLILIGDADQLPSVNAGAVLRDLIAGEATDSFWPGFTAVRLSRNFRVRETASGRGIMSAALAINSGRPEELFEPQTGPVQLRGSLADLAFRGVELLAVTGKEDLNAFLELWYDTMLRPDKGLDPLVRKVYRLKDETFGEIDTADLTNLFEHFEKSIVLCLTNAFHTGADRANRYFHEKALQAAGRGFKAAYLPGEPVIMQHNDYDRNIFNGDRGLIVRVSTARGRHTFRAVFRQPEGFRSYDPDSLKTGLSHAYAITVHKSQGSEFESAALILPDEDTPLLSREILYTGVTRCRSSVVIAGDRDLFAAGVTRRTVRSSGIRERLKKAFGDKK